MAGLFDNAEADHLAAAEPLAARMRPRRLSELIGQNHLLGRGQLLPRMVAAGRLGSIILHGPPGTGKTTLARVLASETGSDLIALSAVCSGVKDVRSALAAAGDTVATGGRPPVLFIDEIHRFSRSQQDSLLADVESGVVSLIGATTSNPYFAINAALISRSQLFELRALEAGDIRAILRRALADRQRGIAGEVDEEAIAVLAEACGGDARRALSVLELAVQSGSGRVTAADIAQCMTTRLTGYDASGEEHYDLASALIKSLRGSDVDAAMYWLARMLEGGEDVRFLCRRLIILASEDVGNADPQALPLAVAAMQACEFVGLPEAQLTLSQTVAYLALAPKSGAATSAISAARADVRDRATVPVPMAIRCSHYAAAAKLGHGEGYVSPHHLDAGEDEVEYLGVDRQYYHPINSGFERQLAERLTRRRGRQRPRGGD